MELGLRGRVVIITGGTTGIGRALVEAFLAEDCHVAACGRDAARVEEMGVRYPGILAMCADVACEEDLNALAQATAERFGGVDVWVNNAGISPRVSLLDMRMEQWDAVMAVNLKGVWLGARAAVPYMEKRGGGVIINASSFTTIMPTALSGAYSASKSGVNALTAVLAAELASRGIRVVAYTPGLIAVPRMAARIENDGVDMMAPIPLRRYGRPEDIAPAVVFLASDQAAYVTGTTMPITGGKFCVQNVPSVADSR